MNASVAQGSPFSLAAFWQEMNASVAQGSPFSLAAF
jgi:hypothetical protein